MEQPQKAAAEPVSKRNGRIFFVGEACVIELEFIKGIAQLLVVVGIYRIHGGKHHGLNRFEPCTRFRTGAICISERVADLHIGDGFNTRNNIADFSCTERIPLHKVKNKNARLLYTVFRIAVHKANGHAGRYRPLKHPQVDNNPAVCVIVAVKDERLQGGFCGTRRRREVLHNGFKQCIDILSCFCRNRNGNIGIKP